MAEITKRYGIIGYPLSHSFSPGYFAAKFEREGLTDCRYDAYPLASIDLLPTLLAETPGLRGLNVTIPYKSSVIPYLDGLSGEAAAVGAVNVVKIEGGKLFGHNSDVHGFEVSLRNFLPKPLPANLQALVLGTGGAAKAVQFVLKKMGVPHLLVSRRESKENTTYEAITPSIFAAHQLIVNTTPLGMSPNINDCPPIPYELATPSHYFYDLVYNPEKTRFLAQGEAAGGHILNGLPMLYLQAERAWQIWGGPTQNSKLDTQNL
jgi:shikimate dehydrogenase